MTQQTLIPWAPDPVQQRLGTCTLEHVLELPEDGRRVELFAGRMLPLPAPALHHQLVVQRLATWLDRHSPEGLICVQGVGIALGSQHSCEPDLVVIKAEGAADSHFFVPSQVVLAVEVVTPKTERQDRFEKPADYSNAKIPHFWRVETDPVHIWAYQLGSRGHYEPQAEGSVEFSVNAPFKIRLPTSEIAP